MVYARRADTDTRARGVKQGLARDVVSVFIRNRKILMNSLAREGCVDCCLSI